MKYITQDMVIQLFSNFSKWGRDMERDPIAQFYERLWQRIDWAVQLSLYWAEDIALEILEPFLVRGMWWEYIDICWKHAVKARKYERQ